MKHYVEARLFKVVEYVVEADGYEEAEQKVRGYIEHGCADGVQVSELISQDLDPAYSLYITTEKE